MSDRSRTKEFVFADTAIVSCKLLGGILRLVILCDVGALGTPRPMGIVPALAAT